MSIAVPTAVILIWAPVFAACAFWLTLRASRHAVFASLGGVVVATAVAVFALTPAMGEHSRLDTWVGTAQAQGAEDPGTGSGEQ
ncbi:hypothetical protein [Corynebacterium sp. AOP12-C2-36]|uniref:hypothetical protein n=1 Tax=Corynebacterium sp. AOP12-C2-36 TaxID=3457723 RepID=UPI0040347676